MSKNKVAVGFRRQKPQPPVNQPIPKPDQRLAKVVWSHDNLLYFVIRITTTGRVPVVEDYFCRKITESACTLTKMEVQRITEYNVFFGKSKFCGCEAFKFDVNCKHIQALETLFSEGK